MNWVFLSVAAIKSAQANLIDKYGGSHGLRDAGLLESEVLRAENKVNFSSEATVQAVAASLSFGLIKNHAFVDGNKRIGLSALVDFLAANGFIVTVPEEDQIAMVLKVASSESSEEEWSLGGAKCPAGH